MVLHNFYSPVLLGDFQVCILKVYEGVENLLEGGLNKRSLKTIAGNKNNTSIFILVR